MKTFNKCLEPNDYRELGMWVYLYDFAVESRAVPYMPNPHVHRRWEYGMAMEFLEQLGGVAECPNILDVGGAGSLFAPIALSMGYSITVIDPDPCVYMLVGQHRAVAQGGNIAEATAINQDFMEWEGGQYDVVLSLSTIEHIEDDVAFVKKLQTHAKRGLFLTTDFSMGGGQFSAGHLRTYTPKTLKNKLMPALDPAWKMLGTPEWQDNGPYVMGYNFASCGCVYEPD